MDPQFAAFNCIRKRKKELKKLISKFKLMKQNLPPFCSKKLRHKEKFRAEFASFLL